MNQAITEYGYALCDIVTAITSLVLEIDLPDRVVAFIMDKLSSIEHRLAGGVSEKLEIGSLVGVFTIARSMMTPLKKV